MKENSTLSVRKAKEEVFWIKADKAPPGTSCGSLELAARLLSSSFINPEPCSAQGSPWWASLLTSSRSPQHSKPHALFT